MIQKDILLLARRAPGILAKEALDAALVASAFDQKTSILFRDEGVLQLRSRADDENSSGTQVTSLNEYGIEKIYVCATSVQRYGLSAADLSITVEVLTGPQQTDLIAAQDIVLND